MAGLDDLTPLRIRGKRRGTPAEKWKTGRRRKPELQKRPCSFEHGTNSAGTPSVRPRKQRPVQQVSPLEDLPAEILQAIFDYAGNIDLPVVSRPLAAKLSNSQHLQTELTNRLLAPVLNVATDTSSAKDRRAATRLLNSRFMTWQFFKSWLSRFSAASAPNRAPEDTEESSWAFVWSSLHPSRALLPPKKLLLPPFSEDKVSFLSTLLNGTTEIADLDPSYGELAYDCLVAAIHGGNTDVVDLLLKAGLKSSTELLRIAVADAGCNQDIVQMLVSAGTASRPRATASKSAIDLLDQDLWSWAEQARQQGNVRGPWLISYLQDLQREHIARR